MLVEEVMSTEVVTVDRSASLRMAVETLLERDVGSVVVISDEGHPVGIVTESDALRAALRTGDPLRKINVADLSHRPVVKTKPSATVEGLARTMAEEGVKKVPVMDGIDLVGMITLTDVVWNLSDIRSQARETGEAISRWSP
ncbi:MAG: CBS domain-containing protein [Salinirussus sp.]